MGDFRYFTMKKVGGSVEEPVIRVDRMAGKVAIVKGLDTGLSTLGQMPR